MRARILGSDDLRWYLNDASCSIAGLLGVQGLGFIGLGFRTFSGQDDTNVSTVAMNLSANDATAGSRKIPHVPPRAPRGHASHFSAHEPGRGYHVHVEYDTS